MKKTPKFFTRVGSNAAAMSVGTRSIRERAVQFIFKLLLVCLLPATALLNPAPASAAQTIVSLTFDDGLNQSQVLDMLLFHNMKATFYINSNMIGTGGGYLSKAELDAIYTAGNEIGGHTIDHVDLATLTDAQQQAAICNDMQNLNTWYPGQIHTFAYPFASTGPTTQSIVAAGCPGVGTYTNARTVGGLVSGTQCTACPTAESIPPGNPYYIQTPESILSTTTLDQLKTYVTQAENNGGGWVPLVFHNVCDGCDAYSITAANLDAFLTWLQAREAMGTYVRTVNQVMTGDLPAPPPPPPAGANQLINPSLEIDQNADSIADCWTRNNNGTSTATWTRTSDAHSGVFADQVDVTAYSSGDLKLMPTMDINQTFGGCSPTVENGASYRLGAWYKSTTPVTPVVFYQDSIGAWQYWMDGPLLPASTGWAQMSFETGPVPAGATALSFGIAIQAVGTLTTDDYSMEKVLNSTDPTPPTVALTGPAAGPVTGTVSVTADATDNVGVAGVQFQLDGVALGGEVTTAPYALAWDTTTAGNGPHNLTAVARDAAGNVAISAAVAVTVNNNDTTAPTVAITAPVAGVVAGTVSVTASASDNVGVAGVQFQLDGVNLGTEVTTAPYSVSWDTLTTTDGSHTLTALARDAAGNTATAATVTVTVSNSDPTPPTVALTAPVAGTVSGAVTLLADATDNVGVVGVQFQLDGANLGAEDTTAPYSVAWDTLTVANGAHSLTAVARDAAGNSTTSAAVAVTVNNADVTLPTVSITAPTTGSTVSGTVSVAANATDNIGVAGVQFQLDGANLGTEVTAAPYSVAWDTTSIANGAHTLTAVARDAAGNLATSTAVSVTVNNIDATAPTVALTGPAAGTITGTVTVAATATDNVGVVGVQFQLNGANLGAEDTTAPYSVAWDTLTVTNGAYSLTAVARDAAGNTTTSAAIAVTVSNADLAAPTVSLTGPAAGTVTGTVNVTANATDNIGVAGVQFQLDGANLGAEVTTAPYTVAWDTLTATNGTHALTAVARDAANNITTSSTVTVTVNNPDITAPTVSLTAPAAGTVLGTISVTADATDNIGVVGVQFQLDGANLGTEVTTAPYSVSWDTLTASNGTHTLTAVARDAANNSTTSSSVTVTVNNPDITAPTVALTAPAAGTVLGTLSVSATASDNIGVVGVQFKLDGALLGSEDTTAPYSVSWDTLTASNGTHTLTAVARDAAGNATTSSSVTVTVNNPDLTAPSVSISAPAAGTVSGTVSVLADATDNIGVAGVQFQLDGVNLGGEDTTAPYAISWNTTSVGNGTHTLTALARDAAGNTTTSGNVTVTVNNPDITAPTVALTTPSAGTVLGIINVAATAADNIGVAGVQFQLDGANLGSEVTAAPYALFWDSTTTPNGIHTLTAVARDAAGNSTTSSTVSVTVNNPDITAPSVSITAPAAGTVLGTVSVTADALDNIGVAGVQFQLDGVNLGGEVTTAPYAISWNTTSVGNGTHTLTAVARDAAGNNTTSGTVSVTVNNPDITAPTVTLTAPAAGTVTGTVTLTADAADNLGVVGVQFQLDGVNLGSEVTAAPYSVTWNTANATNGIHSLTVVARDAAGNTTTSAAVEVTVSHNTSVGYSGGGGGGGGAFGLMELAWLLMFAGLAAVTRNRPPRNSDENIG